MMRRYNFDRIRNGRVKAEGIAVHAENLEEAKAKASAAALMLYGTDKIIFRDNMPCSRGCYVCIQARQTSEATMEIEDQIAVVDCLLKELDRRAGPVRFAALTAVRESLTKLHEATTLRPMSEYHEDYGPMLWWKVPVNEPPYCGWKNNDDFDEDFYTHFTPLLIPRKHDTG